MPAACFSAQNFDFIGQEKDGESKQKDLNSLSWASASTKAPAQEACPLSELAFESEKEDVEEAVALPYSGDHGSAAPIELGRPGSACGFYGLMQYTRDLRAALVEQLFNRENEGGHCQAHLKSLRDALANLQKICRPLGWRIGDADDMHVLRVGTAKDMHLRLGYEKHELSRDLCLLDDGEESLLEVIRQEHADRTAMVGSGWVEGKLPSWENCVNDALITMRAASTSACSDAGFQPGRFRNWITDRDGTINNYCDRYPSSVQSLYNAKWVGQFARKCNNAILITSAPLGGRQGSQGLVELCTMPHGVMKYVGSKGREYYNEANREVVEVEPLPVDQRELLEKVSSRLEMLCYQPNNSIFLGIGSGLQRKFGEITIARNDPGRSISDSMSDRFMAEVQRLVQEIDPEGSKLCMHDTGTDVEIFPCRADGLPCFSKGDGVIALDRKLRLGVAEGPNLICGDTPSDVPMIEVALRSMAAPDGSPRLESRLAVLFVVTAEQHARTPDLAAKVRTLCAEGGAHCAILPSPDVLVAALAQYAKDDDASES